MKGERNEGGKMTGTVQRRAEGQVGCVRTSQTDQKGKLGEAKVRRGRRVDADAGANRISYGRIARREPASPWPLLSIFYLDMVKIKTPRSSFVWGSDRCAYAVWEILFGYPVDL